MPPMKLLVIIAGCAVFALQLAINSCWEKSSYEFRTSASPRPVRLITPSPAQSAVPSHTALIASPVRLFGFRNKPQPISQNTPEPRLRLDS
jgi:hypothetical protein